MKDNTTRVHGLCCEDFVVGLIAHIPGGYLRYSQEPEIEGTIVDRKKGLWLLFWPVVFRKYMR